MTKWYALNPTDSGLKVMPLGECRDYEDAADKADVLCCDNLWVTTEADIRGLFDSARDALLGGLDFF